MSPELFLTNLAQYAWQSVALIGVGIALPVVFRLREPRAHLLYLRTLLLAAVLLPWLQPYLAPALVAMAPNDAVVSARLAAVPLRAAAADWTWQVYAILLLASGVALRLAWLALGLMALRRYRAGGRPIECAAVESARQATQVAAVVVESAAVPGPVTFGYWRPLILVPPAFHQLSPASQFAVAAHEFLHVRRADWLHTLGEEVLLAALWWHPGIWFLVSRLRLSREQVIDRAVIAFTDSPQAYVQALLALADSPLPASLAPHFLRRRHLAVRIQQLLSEVNMSPTRLFTTYSLVTALATATAWLSISSFPMQAAPQESTGAEVVLRKPAVYPSLAKQKRVEGSVIVEATIADNGSVADARVLSGPVELRRAALESVLQWQFKNGQMARVTLNFSLAPDAGTPPSPGTLHAVEIRGVPARVEETLRARLAHLVDQPFQAGQLLEIVRSVAPELAVSFQSGGGSEYTANIESPRQDPFPKGDGQRLRVGGLVQEAKLSKRVRPDYPALAKQARIQGTVRFQTLIGPDGRVLGLALVSGHPLLVAAAQESLQQWVYEPTLLNGNPVEVLSLVDINFTLAP